MIRPDGGVSLDKSPIVPFILLAVVVLAVVVGFIKDLKQRWIIPYAKELGTLPHRKGIFITIYDWEYALLYVNGRFSRLLPSGHHFNFGLEKRNVYILHKYDQFITTSLLDVTSADKLLFRLGVMIVYEIIDPQRVLESGDHDAHLRLAATNALTRLAADHTLDAFLSERAALDEKLLAMFRSPIVGCTIKTVFITSVTLPPEIRRMFTEVERAKLEGLAALERARGEHAALRSLANAARMLKGNPELMNLRVLQSLSAPQGNQRPTLVLGQGSLLPVGSAADSGAQE